ncbi:MAG: ATP-binding protein, partial [Rubripirellula sp.]
FIDATDNAVNRAVELVKNLMGVSRQSQLTMRPQNVNQVVRQVNALLKRSIDVQYELELDLDQNVHDCMIDENQVVQVLLNICLNSRDAMAPGGGTISISTANVSAEELSESPLSLRSAPDDSGFGYVRIRVRDSGHGIPASIHAEIFEPFYTTKPPGQGTGLGLATSKGIIEQHGGDILLQSQEHEGACFDVFLPAIPSTSNAPPKLTHSNQVAK